MGRGHAGDTALLIVCAASWRDLSFLFLPALRGGRGVAGAAPRRGARLKFFLVDLVVIFSFLAKNGGAGACWGAPPPRPPARGAPLFARGIKTLWLNLSIPWN